MSETICHVSLFKSMLHNTRVGTYSLWLLIIIMPGFYQELIIISWTLLEVSCQSNNQSSRKPWNCHYLSVSGCFFTSWLGCLVFLFNTTRFFLAGDGSSSSGSSLSLSLLSSFSWPPFSLMIGSSLGASGSTLEAKKFYHKMFCKCKNPE